MKNSHFTPVLLVIAGLLGACNSMPKTTSLLDQTRSEYLAAQSNPKVTKFASLEMKQAGDAMQLANAASRDNDSVEKIDQLAYLAKQKIALTEEVAKRKSAEMEVAQSASERDRMRLEQRTNEADRANVATRVARNDTAVAQRQTQAAEAYSEQLQAQLADLSAKMTERGLVITLGDVLFQTDKARLNPEGQGMVKKLADVLQQHPKRTVLIEGFTDSTGSAAYNQTLSERRAMSVRRSLQAMGVGRERIAIRGFGESYPIASNQTSEERQLNRRVEIVLSNEQGVIRPR
jgi:outer membrane protein OmpA-like peptidoglycan-associated protein